MKTTVSALLILALFATSPILSQDQPGNGKKFGVAINPVFALFSIASLEFNVWNIDRRAEINIPVIFSNNAKFGKDVKVSFEEVGIHYRYFFNQRQKGFFAEAGWQYDYLRQLDEDLKTTQSGHSLMFGFGYRMLTQSGFFWGCALRAGRFWGKKTEIDYEFEDTETSHPTFNLDIDLFKFGYAW